MQASPLLGPNSGPTLHSHQASISFLLFVTPPRLCLLLRDPFTNVGGAVSEFVSVRFTDCQELYGLAVHDKNVLEINSYCASFLFQQRSKHVHFLSANPSADA